MIGLLLEMSSTDTLHRHNTFLFRLNRLSCSSEKLQQQKNPTKNS